VVVAGEVRPSGVVVTSIVSQGSLEQPALTV
jgi:hypothetical protein